MKSAHLAESNPRFSLKSDTSDGPIGRSGPVGLWHRLAVGGWFITAPHTSCFLSVWSQTSPPVWLTIIWQPNTCQLRCNRRENVIFADGLSVLREAGEEPQSQRRSLSHTCQDGARQLPLRRKYERLVMKMLSEEAKLTFWKTPTKTDYVLQLTVSKVKGSHTIKKNTFSLIMFLHCTFREH